MKRIAGLALTVFFVGMFSGLANAAFFDDSGGQWWMNAGQWQENQNFDSGNHIGIADQNNRLEFSSDITSHNGYDSWGMMVSKWTLSLDQDFDISINYYHNAIKPESSSGYSDLELDLVDGRVDPSTSQQPDYIFAVGARSQTENITSLAGLTDIQTPAGGEVDQYWARSVAGGVLTAHYDAALDKLELSAVENGASTGNGTTVDGLKGTYNLDSLRLIFGAGSDGFSFSGDQVYLQNCNLKSGTVTPEPVSAALFVLGAGALAGARRLRKRA